MGYEIHLLLLRTEVPEPRELAPAMLSTSAPWTKCRRLEAVVQCTPCRRRWSKVASRASSWYSREPRP